MPEFCDVNQENPNCVVVGDAAENFTYENLNKAFNLLMGMDAPILMTMGFGLVTQTAICKSVSVLDRYCRKFYKETHGLMMDLGGYTKALEYASDVKAELVGKPDPLYFDGPLSDMGLKPGEVILTQFFQLQVLKRV